MESTEQDVKIPLQKHGSESIEEDDHELLAFQKQRSTPKVSLSNFGEEEEQVVVEVDDFGQVTDHPQLIGMLSAGTEERMMEEVVHDLKEE